MSEPVLKTVPILVSSSMVIVAEDIRGLDATGGRKVMVKQFTKFLLNLTVPGFAWKAASDYLFLICLFAFVLCYYAILTTFMYLHC